MMRRGPLAGNPIEALLDAAADERANGVIELHSVDEGRVYLVEGEVYFADLLDHRPLEQLMLEAGLLTQAQIDRHTEPGDDMPYLALALDTDTSIDDAAIGAWLFDRTAATLMRFIGVSEGEYELDPYASHPMGILASWPHNEVLDRAQVLRAEAEQRAEAERIEAERVAAERQAEIERREAEQRADAERAAARARLETEQAATEGSGEESSAAADSTAPTAGAAAVAEPSSDAAADHDPHAHLPPPPGGEHPAAPATPGDVDTGGDAQVLIVTADAAPEGLDPIELSPLEWRVVVLAARGMALSDLARRLNLGRDEVAAVVTALSERGLLATVG